MKSFPEPKMTVKLFVRLSLSPGRYRWTARGWRRVRK